MKKQLLFVFLVVGFCFSRAQNLDSLWQVYNNKTQADTNRLKALQTLIRNYSGNNPDTAIVLAQQEEKLAGLLPSSSKKIAVSGLLPE